MKNNKESLIFAFGLLLIVLITGVSFAYFSAIISGSESESTITMDAGELSITYSDNSNELNITASKIYPRDEEWITKEFKVTGNNTTELAMYYKINLVIDNNEFGSELTYSLESENTSDNGAVIANISSGTIDETTEELGKGYFVEGENQEHNYTLKIYFKDNGEDQNTYQKAKFAAHVEIEGAGTILAKPKGWDDATSGTLLAGIKANYNNVSEPLTVPGKEASTSDETVMASTEDDYGTSYYFRGNVQNNFVVFANMCWRIVRVTGDGSIKLVLYNYSSDDCTETGNYLAFARYSGDTYTTAFNTKAEDNAVIGFMYGTIGSTTYAETHANKNKSTILTNLETWYKNNIASYADNLADTIWCNDKSTKGDGYGTTNSSYGANSRYKSPSLICPDDKEDGKLSKFTVNDKTNGNGALTYKIGLLTSDEALFGGLEYFGATITSYLAANTGDKWWTMSPADFSTRFAYVWYANTSGSIYDGMIDDPTSRYDIALRPSLALKNTTTITSGNGTASSPFIVS